MWALAGVLVVVAGALAVGCGQDTGFAGGSRDDLDGPAVEASCPGNLSTAANTGIHAFGFIQEGRDPLIQPGVDDPFECAYQLLCAAQRTAVSRDDFRRTRGEAVSPVFSADDVAGPSVYDDRGLSTERPTGLPDDPQLNSTWIEFEADWYVHVDEHTVSGLPRVEHWRVDFVREEGQWRLCQFERVA